MNHQSEAELTSTVRIALLFVGEKMSSRGDLHLLAGGEFEAAMTGERPVSALTARVVQAALCWFANDIESCANDIREALADLPPSEREQVERDFLAL